MKNKTRILIVVYVWLATIGLAPNTSEMYLKGVKFAKAGQHHFAFMHFNNLLRNFPESKYRQNALFATGEYYFQVSGFDEAIETFERFVEENPDSQEKLYALAYLLNIANQGNDVLIIQGLEKEVINFQKVSFIFREKKEITYQSPLYQHYKAIIHIDKIEFYVEGELIAQVSY